MVEWLSSKDGFTGWAQLLENGKVKFHKRKPSLLSIGEMIQFLDEHELKIMISNHPSTNDEGWGLVTDVEINKGFQSKELVDLLWQAVKEILENKEKEE